MPEARAQAQRSGLRWGLVIGCLGAGCIMLVLAAAGIVVAATVGLFALLKGSGAYELALERIQGSTAVVDAIGRPVEPGWWVLGRIEYSGNSGSAELTIPLLGPKGRATAYAEAVREGGKWRLVALSVVIHKTGQRIELVEPPGAQETRPPPV